MAGDCLNFNDTVCLSAVFTVSYINTAYWSAAGLLFAFLTYCFGFISYRFNETGLKRLGLHVLSVLVLLTLFTFGMAAALSKETCKDSRRYSLPLQFVFSAIFIILNGYVVITTIAMIKNLRHFKALTNSPWIIIFWVVYCIAYLIALTVLFILDYTLWYDSGDYKLVCVTCLEAITTTILYFCIAVYFRVNTAVGMGQLLSYLYFLMFYAYTVISFGQVATVIVYVALDAETRSPYLHFLDPLTFIFELGYVIYLITLFIYSAVLQLPQIGISTTISPSKASVHMGSNS
mmetsp:Transcript_6893/g.17382  ORF Transcript_6893/g.17382 Transcript_6893/m.17382 type:complete len:290 (-) Transcript_6893:80-949(-)